MTESVEIVTIKLLDRTYQIKCPVDKSTALQEAVNFLDVKIREITEGHKSPQLEQIFMIAALNITDELIHSQRQNQNLIELLNQKIQRLQSKIEQVLGSN